MTCLIFLDEYTSTYEPEDQLEWSLVLGEIKEGGIFGYKFRMVPLIKTSAKFRHYQRDYLVFKIFVDLSRRCWDYLSQLNKATHALIYH